MNNYSVKDFMNDVFNPFNKQAKKLSRFYKYVLIVKNINLSKNFFDPIIILIFLRNKVG